MEILFPNLIVLQKKGYTFGGWYKEKECTTPWDFGKDTITEDTTLYAKWVCSVTFVGEGGSEVEDQVVEINSLLTEPTAPTKTGNVFLGWYIDKEFENAWNFESNKILQDTTLYARWKTKSYTVTFESNGGTEVENEKVKYKKLASQPNDPTKDGYTFGGWYVNEDCTVAWNFLRNKITKNKTIYAKWVCTATFNSKGGSEVDNQVAEIGSLLTEPTEPTNKGYTFGGWYLDENYFIAWDFNSETITENTTLYAKWVCTATFNTKGGSEIDIQVVEINSLITEPEEPTRTGYVFKGWYSDKKRTVAWNFETDIITENTTIYAGWTINTYSVTFESNGGTEVDSQTIKYNKLVSRSTNPTKEGYTFGGWYADEALTIAWDFDSDTITEDTTLYADWVCKVSFISNGGTKMDNQLVDEGGMVSEPEEPTKTGYIFEDWYADEELTILWDFETDTISENTILYAKWVCKVIFNSNGGSVVSNQIVEINSLVTEPKDPIRKGYALDGWYTDKECTTVWNFETDTITENITLYAAWTINTYTVTFDSDGGTEIENQNIDYKNLVSKPTDPTKEGYTFGGWYVESECKNEWYFDTDTVVKDITLYAYWIE
jgi:uncharacterized repeat protein (TIGR02543 family)